MMSSRSTRQQRQTGVISVLAALALGVSVVVAALALDLGRVYWIKRDLQKAADLASLSAVSDLSNATAIAQSIVNANGFVYPATGNTMTVTTGAYTWAQSVPPVEGHFSPGGAVDSINSVEVIVSTTVPYYFIPGSLRVEASGISVRDPVAGFSLGSFIARLNTDDSPLLNGLLNGVLGGLLGSSSGINLDLASYKGLAAGTVKLGDLQLALGFGTVDELLKADISFSNLLGGAAEALGQGAVADTLNTLSNAAAPDRSLVIGDLLKVDTSNPQAAANAEVNVMELVQLGAQVANGKHFIDIPNLGVSVGSLVNVGLGLSVIDPPTIASGPARKDANGNWITRAHAAQIRLKLGLKLDLAVLQVNLPIYIESGAADAELTKACRPTSEYPGYGSPRNATIGVTPQLLTTYVGNVDNAAMENHSAPVTVSEAMLVNVLGLITIKGYAKAVVGGGQSRDLVFDESEHPFDQYNVKSTASLGIGSALGAALDGNMDSHVVLSLLGIPLIDAGPIIDAILALLNSVLDTLLDPLLSLLGVSLGGADVTAFYLNCGVPQLVNCGRVICLP